MPLQYGNISITLKSEEKDKHWTIREFLLVKVCICVYMTVYACAWMYTHVFVCVCMVHLC